MVHELYEIIDFWGPAILHNHSSRTSPALVTKAACVGMGRETKLD
jgi:hypothetical protein